MPFCHARAKQGQRLCCGVLGTGERNLRGLRNLKNLRDFWDKWDFGDNDGNQKSKIKNN
jgi:hypothetical protein